MRENKSKTESIWPDVGRWLNAIIRHWIAIAGGAAVAVILLVASVWVGGNWLRVLSVATLFGSFVCATFLAWRDEYRKTIGKQRRWILEQVIQLVNDKPEEVDVLGAVIRLSDNFGCEEDVEWVCRQIDEHGHLNPFGVLDESFDPGFDGKRLKFLQDARIASGQIYSIGDAMRYVASTWAPKNGLSEKKLSDRDHLMNKFFVGHSLTAISGRRENSFRLPFRSAGSSKSKSLY